MIKLGLTGGIGSGKTTISKVFETLGTPVFYADNEAKKFLFDKKLKKKLELLFGSSIIDDKGDVDKKKLAYLVFNNKLELKKLNDLIHPLLMREFDLWSMQKEKQGFNFLIIEAAILFEAGFDANVDKILTISAPISVRIERVMKRDNAERSAVEARISNQITDEERESKSDYVIMNSNSDMIFQSINRINTELNSL